MILGLLLLVAAVLLAAVGAPALSRVSRGAGDPDLTLVSWAAVMAAALVSAVSGSSLLLLGERSHSHLLAWQACWAFFGHSTAHPFDELAGAGLAVVLAVTLVRAGAFIRRAIAAQRRVHRAHVALWRLKRDAKEDNIIWLEHEKPFAYSVPGRPGLIIASTALGRLPTAFRDAVFQHEHHHLRRRHHVLIIAARALRHAVSPLPLFRQLPTHVESVTEHAADAHATKHCGREAVHGALNAIDQHGHTRTRVTRLAMPTADKPAGQYHLTVFALSAAPVLLGAAMVLTC